MLVTVDTGGTKTLIASFGEDGVMENSIKFPTPKDQTQYTKLLIETLQREYESTEIDALVIALPGRVNNDQVLEYARHLNWRDFDIKRELEPYFSCPILIEHDANLAGLAVSRQLETPVHACLYVTISTGIGTGLIINGHIDIDYKQSEGGRMVLEYNGELMHWEDFASGRAIKDEYGSFASEIEDAGTWREIADKISRGFLVVTPLLRPDMIVIGGSIGTYFDLYKTELDRLLKARLHYVPPIIAARDPEQAVIYGCYYYGVDYLSNQ